MHFMQLTPRSSHAIMTMALSCRQTVHMINARTTVVLILFVPDFLEALSKHWEILEAVLFAPATLHLNFMGQYAGLIAASPTMVDVVKILIAT